jgi:glycosyltransferase involved in cell wall biosynthesis
VKVFYNQQNVPDFLATGDLFLYATSPDSNDSLPRAVLEAQAAGLSVVTTGTAGCGEIVEDGATGFVVPYDADALAARALDLLADPDRRRLWGMRAQEHVRARFDWETVADAYARLCREILGNPGRPALTDSFAQVNK